MTICSKSFSLLSITLTLPSTNRLADITWREFTRIFVCGQSFTWTGRPMASVVTKIRVWNSISSLQSWPIVNSSRTFPRMSFPQIFQTSRSKPSDNERSCLDCSQGSSMRISLSSVRSSLKYQKRKHQLTMKEIPQSWRLDGERSRLHYSQGSSEEIDYQQSKGRQRGPCSSFLTSSLALKYHLSKQEAKESKVELKHLQYPTQAQVMFLPDYTGDDKKIIHPKNNTRESTNKR